MRDPKNAAACTPANGANAGTILSRYGITHQNKQPLTLEALRTELWQGHGAIISHHVHPSGSVHYVVLTDTYRLHGEDMVVMFDGKFGSTGGYWVYQYSEYLKDHFGTAPDGTPNGWKVDGMMTNFVKQ